jgi:RNA recognition motif-containing protein
MSKIYVGGLPPGCDERDMEDAFRKFGTLRSTWVARNPSGFAFLVLGSSNFLALIAVHYFFRLGIRG